ncbi:MAG: peptidase caspase catalytic subunit p20 [Ramlibacter sp.]|jgi:hypothetical protein|nr:peptidase caspase catalytic subunit p20 [Ramlibacter sp.]
MTTKTGSSAAAPARKAKALSLHLGLNSVSAAAYSGWDGPLAACEFDATDMAAIAKSQGMEHKVLRTKKATRARFLAALRDAAKALKKGDFFFLTFSGHGGQVRDANGDEPDHKDETWCLYDGQLVDDELYVELSLFAEGVRILVLSDSCHSGTVTRAKVPVDPDEALAGVGATAPAAALVGEFKPAVILVSGCQDRQTSMDGRHNGAFTEQLLNVWNEGAFTGNYDSFHARIRAALPRSQSPNLFVLGKAKSFLAQKPFTV